MAVAALPFGSFRPDQPSLTRGIVTVADNVTPAPNGWEPMPAFVASLGTALPASPKGAVAARSSTGVTTIFAGTVGNLYRYTTSGWSGVGSGYNAPTTGWSFVQYGDRVIAFNGADAPQKLDLLTDSAFSALAGSPPTLAFATVVKNFIVGGRPNGIVNAIQWCANNNSEIWEPGVGEADNQLFPDGGDVTAIAGGEYGLVFQRDCIRRMDYVGGNLIFDISVISPNIGCVAPKSFAQLGQRAFFWSRRGFMTCDGVSVQPIGDQRVDRTFNALASQTDFSSMSAVADPVRKLVIWTVPAADPNVWFVFNWALGEWSIVRQAARLIFPASSPTASLEDLDALAPPNLDGAGITVDDPAFAGGVPSIYLFNGSSQLGTMSGANMAWALEVPFLEPVEGRSVKVRRVRPLTDAISGLTLKVSTRARLGDASVVKTQATMQADGTMPILAHGRFVSARLEAAAGTPCTFVRGIRAEFEPQGRGL